MSYDLEQQNKYEQSQISLQKNYNKYDNIDLCEVIENKSKEQQKSFDQVQYDIEMSAKEKNLIIPDEIQQQCKHEQKKQEQLKKNEEKNMQIDESNKLKKETHNHLNQIHNHQQQEYINEEQQEEKKLMNQIIEGDEQNQQINHQQSQQYDNEQDNQKSKKNQVTEEAEQVQIQDNKNDCIQQDYMNLEVHNSQDIIQENNKIQQQEHVNIVQVSTQMIEQKQIQLPINPEQYKLNSQNNEQQQYFTAQQAQTYDKDNPPVKLNFPPQISEDVVIYGLNIFNEFNQSNLTFYMAEDDKFYMSNSAKTISYDQMLRVKRQIEDILVQISMKTNYDTIYQDILKFIQQKSI